MSIISNVLEITSILAMLYTSTSQSDQKILSTPQNLGIVDSVRSITHLVNNDSIHHYETEKTIHAKIMEDWKADEEFLNFQYNIRENLPMLLYLVEEYKLDSIAVPILQSWDVYPEVVDYKEATIDEIILRHYQVSTASLRKIIINYNSEFYGIDIDQKQKSDSISLPDTVYIPFQEGCEFFIVFEPEPFLGGKDFWEDISKYYDIPTNLLKSFNSEIKVPQRGDRLFIPYVEWQYIQLFTVDNEK